jgi:DNA replication ATP-dependent helicase Dna2
MQPPSFLSAEYFFAEAQTLYQQFVEVQAARFISEIKTLLEQALNQLLQNESVYLNKSLSARIDYAKRKFNLSSITTYYLYKIRVWAEALPEEEISEQESEDWRFLQGLRAFIEFITQGYKKPWPSWALKLPPYQKPQQKIEEKIPEVRTLFRSWHEETGYALCQTVSQGLEVLVKLEPPLGSPFTPADVRQMLWEGAEIHLVDALVRPNGVWEPKFWTLESDFLIDVTAVADCYDSPLLWLRRKFITSQTSPAMIIGNVANFMLDTLIHAPENQALDFRDIFTQTFALYPFQYALLDDEALKEVYQKAQLQFKNILRVVRNNLPAQGFKREKATLEPSFISSKYGIQGRLDLLWQDEKGLYNIIELKSGSPPGNSLWPEHSAQAQLYRLLISSVWGESKVGQVAVFYSQPQENNIRFDPSFLQKQQKIIFRRNQLLALEHTFAQSPQAVMQVLQDLNRQEIAAQKGFNQADLLQIYETWQKASPLEKSYVAHFVYFAAQENWSARLGRNGTHTDLGHSGIWLRSLAEKEEKGEILAYLQYQNSRPENKGARLVWKPTEKTLPHANFRVGDIIILYPQNKRGALGNQLYKGTLIKFDRETIEVDLRHPLTGQDPFLKEKFWRIEKDYMDTTLNAMNKNLWHFLRFTGAAKDWILGSQLPRFSQEPIPLPNELLTRLNANQQNLLQRALAAQDYFLIQGPPGTGKTKIMLRALVEYYFRYTTQNILLLSFTNRAVDEICESMLAPSPIPFLRIGAESGAPANQHPYLLEKKVSALSRREEIKTLLNQYRIYTATVATLNGRTEIFQLKNFDIAIIDEASQLLEPQLLYILTQVKKFILIGDEKQLPAVVVTAPERTKVDCPLLQAIGLRDLRHSLFERLLQWSRQNGNLAHGMLSAQGRMHQSLQDFPSRFFYEGKLEIANPQKQQTPIQETTLARAYVQNPALALLAQSRLIYIPSIPAKGSKPKQNAQEAQLVAFLVALAAKAYGQNFDPLHTIGVITPFRAQISCIQHYLEQMQSQFPYPKTRPHPFSQITVDTVERYQGGSRAIIIVSFALASASLLPGIVSYTPDFAVDRKLNVALTRAEERLILIGNEAVLRQEPIYKALINYIQEIGGYWPKLGELPPETLAAISQF